MNEYKNTEPFSVIIVHHKRERNLHFTLEGLCFQDVLPHEVIIVNIGELPSIRDEYDFQLTVLSYEEDWKFLPIAASRNLGARQAKTNSLVFLDVDCIPANDFCSSVCYFAESTNGLVMGSPRYMLIKRDVDQGCDDLKHLSIPHPARPMVMNLREENCYELFWSLCFSIRKDVFEHIGGFDEHYEGYAIEDTDFALKAKSKEIPFYLSPAEVFHQQHTLCIPPLNHLESIVANCNHFHSKWGYWPLEDCLVDFRDMGYIEWSKKRQKSIEIIDMPSSEIIRRHQVANAPYR